MGKKIIGIDRNKIRNITIYSCYYKFVIRMKKRIEEQLIGDQRILYDIRIV